MQEHFYIALAGSILFGLLLGWLFAQHKARRVERELTETITTLRVETASLQNQIAGERRLAEEKLSLLENARAKLADSFQALSGEALRQNNQSFLQLAKTTLEKFQETARGDLDKRQQSINELVKPMRESLTAVDGRIAELEKARLTAYTALTEQVKQLGETQAILRSETGNLVQALRSPIVRGRWGEIQLRRVVELAGMLRYCDFTEQESVDGGRLRPDLIVHLPSEKIVVVDAKAPLAAYLEAVEAKTEEQRLQCLKRHAAQVRSHIDQLTRKAYWEQFPVTPEFVILFLPGEQFFGAALEQDPTLIEYGVANRVILATPTTLIALLQAVFHGWRQEKLAENARQISDLGREMHKRLVDFLGHLEKTGRSLGTAVDSYNAAVGSLESRLLVSARKFKELEATTEETTSLPAIEKSVRELQVSE